MVIYGIILSAADLWLLGICGALIVILIGHLLNNVSNQKNRFNEAAAKLRSVVITELNGLYPTPIDWPDNIAARLDRTLPAIQTAIAEFSHFLTDADCKSINATWDQYYKHCKQVIPDAFSDASIFYAEGKSKQAQEQFKAIIEHLLSFAKEK